MFEGAFFILPILYVGTLLAVLVLAIVALWRIMRAQEATANALQQIAQTVARFGPPA